MSSGGTVTPPDVATTVQQIEALATQQGSRVSWFSNWSATFTAVEDLADQFVSMRVNQVTPEKAKEWIDIIRARREKLSLSSGITSQIVGICQQILSFGAAGVALTVGFMDKIKQFSVGVQKIIAIVGIFYFELILLSLLVLIWYMLQARFRYPYLYFDKIGNAWPFFYYASITPVCRSPIQLSTQRFEAATAYASDLVRFTDRTFAEDPVNRLHVELQQYFLLMSYQAYVHQFSLRLASIFMYGFVGALATAGLLFIGLMGGAL